MAFDADQYCAAHCEPPTFLVNGRRFVGRILSANEWVRLHRAQADAQADVAEVEADVAAGTTRTDVTRVVRAALSAAERFSRDCIVSWFPAPWYLRPFAWLWPGAFHPAWKAFRSMPPIAQEKAVVDFSESQRSAMPTSRPRGTKQTETTQADSGPLSAT